MSASAQLRSGLKSDNQKETVRDKVNLRTQAVLTKECTLKITFHKKVLKKTPRILIKSMSSSRSSCSYAHKG